MDKKKEGRRVQTENNRKMCKHIKIKNHYLFPATPFAPNCGKNSARRSGKRKPDAQQTLLKNNFTSCRKS